MSANLFNLLLEIVMRLAEREEEEVGMMINGMTLNNLRFADDIDLIANTEENLQQLTDRVYIDGSSRRMRLRINTGKTNSMTIGKQHEDIQINLGGEVLEQVTKFVYLGVTLTDTGITSNFGPPRKMLKINTTVIPALLPKTNFDNYYDKMKMISFY